VLMIDPADADLGTVAHEMGHAVMEALVHAGPADGKAAAATPVPERVADLFLRLRATKTPVDSTVAVGLLMVDPTEWSPGAKGEHPGENADEFFASAKAAYQVSPKGLAKSIAKATKVDPSVAPLAKELLALLDGIFGKGKLAGETLAADRSKAATAEVARFHGASHIEDSVAIHPQLGWLIDPSSRPRGR
jgi:hypothetical protein